MSTPPTVAVLGTGSFARSLVKELVSEHRGAVHLAVLGRSPQSVEKTVDLARVHAAPHAQITVEPITVDLSPAIDLTMTMRALRPEFVIVCASLHSPYTADRNEDMWASTLRSTEFGFTGLLQAPLAIRAAQAIDRAGCDTRLINACYPDFVNPLLTALGLPVLCGLGNAATLSAGIDRFLSSAGGKPARVLAHHRHLKAGLPSRDELRVWHPRARSADLNVAIGQLRALPRRELNDIGAAAGGRLVSRLLRGEGTHTSVPGPDGLPGGYPVLVDRDRCRLDLPTGMGQQEAVDWNQWHAAAEGIQVRPDGTIRFTGSTALKFVELGVTSGDILDVTEWEAATRRLLQARQVLAACPASDQANPPLAGRTSS